MLLCIYNGSSSTSPNLILLYLKTQYLVLRPGVKIMPLPSIFIFMQNALGFSLNSSFFMQNVLHEIEGVIFTSVCPTTLFVVCEIIRNSTTKRIFIFLFSHFNGTYFRFELFHVRIFALSCFMTNKLLLLVTIFIYHPTIISDIIHPSIHPRLRYISLLSICK